MSDPNDLELDLSGMAGTTRLTISARRHGKTDALWKGSQRWLAETPDGLALWCGTDGCAVIEREAGTMGDYRIELQGVGPNGNDGHEDDAETLTKSFARLLEEHGHQVSLVRVDRITPLVVRQDLPEPPDV